MEESVFIEYVPNRNHPRHGRECIYRVSTKQKPPKTWKRVYL